MARRSISFKMPSSTEPVLAGLKWSERFQCYRTVVAGWLPLSFSWSTTRGDNNYVINVNDRTLKTRGNTPEESARIAAAAAKLWLERAAKELAEATDKHEQSA